MVRMSHAAGPQAPAPPAAARPRGMRGSARSMVISMLVVLAAVAVWVALVPRVSSTAQPVQDPAGVAREVNRQQRWTVALPVGLGERWVPTNVRLVRITDLPPSWQAGYRTPSGEYALVRQTARGDAAWVREQTARGRAQGQVALRNGTWTRYVGGDSGQQALVRTQPLGGLTTVVIGKADFPELEALAAALAPTPAA